MKNRVLIFWPLIIHSLERIDTVSNAMDLRGFGKKDKRTWFYTSKAKREDFIAFICRYFHIYCCGIFKIKRISKLLVSILKHSLNECFYLFYVDMLKKGYIHNV